MVCPFCDTTYMCRDKMHGGRRCPGGMTQARREQVNARRRELYKQKKEQNARSVAEAVSIAGAQTAYAPNNINVTPPTWCQNDISYESGDIQHYESLGITTTKANGVKAEHQFFAPTHVSGKCDVTQLDGNSYQAFGFEKPNEQTYYTDLRQKDTDHYQYWFEECDKEIKAADLESDEKMTVQVYTGIVFSKINAPLRGNSTELVDRPTDTSQTFQNDYQFADYVSDNEMSSQMLKRLTTDLDSALEKGPGLQRIVYRGISDKGLEDSGISRKDLLEKMAIGKEVVFDDYQSASLSGGTAIGFSKKRGVMFEILTPDGLLVESISEEGGEMEVLLPRSSRYIAVGQHQWENPDKAGDTVDIIQLVAVDEEGFVREQSKGIFESPSLTPQQTGVK